MITNMIFGSLLSGVIFTCLYGIYLSTVGAKGSEQRQTWRTRRIIKGRLKRLARSGAYYLHREAHPEQYNPWMYERLSVAITKGKPERAYAAARFTQDNEGNLELTVDRIWATK